METKFGFMLLLSLGSCIVADLQVDELLTGGKCGSFSRIPGGVIKSHGEFDLNLITIKNDFTCLFTIQAFKFRQRIRLFFTQFSLTGNNCSSTHLKIYDGETTSAALIKKICPGERVENEFTSSKFWMTLELKMTMYNAEAPQVTFFGYYASYDVARPGIQSCLEPNQETMCANGRCIYKKLLCDGFDSCGDGSDELRCSGQIYGEDLVPVGEPEKSCGDIQLQRWQTYFKDWIEEYLRWKSNRIC